MISSTVTPRPSNLAEPPGKNSHAATGLPLERRLQLYLGSTTRQAVFVHAGVVGWKGGALVIPGSISRGEAVLKMLSNAVSAQAAPELVLKHLSKAVKQAESFDSTRGEAEETAAKLLNYF